VVLVVAHNVFLRIAHVNARLEDFHLLLGKLCATHSSDEFFGLSREHRAANHLYASRAVRLSMSVFRHIFAAKLQIRFKKCKDFVAFFSIL
jgi:hypothetical protein